MSMVDQQAASVEPGNAEPPVSADGVAPPASEPSGNADGVTPPTGEELNGLAPTPGQGFDQALTDTLSDDNRALVQSDRFKDKDVNALLTSYRELESKLGERAAPQPLAEDATPEQKSEYYTALGRPATPEAYELALPPDLPENTPYDAAFAGEFKHWAHEEGLSQNQAEALHNRYVGMVAQSSAVQFEQLDAQVGEANSQLTSDWGLEDTPKYQRNMEMARRAMDQLGLKKDMVQLGVIHATGAVQNANFIKALSRVGGSMFAEDIMYSGDSTSLENPFSTGKENLTQQSLLIRDDPLRAKSLIRAAGRKNSDFGLADN